MENPIGEAARFSRLFRIQNGIRLLDMDDRNKTAQFLSKKSRLHAAMRFVPYAALRSLKLSPDALFNFPESPTQCENMCLFKCSAKM
ncbi:hypothetical protein C5167_015992 [Papaver somniferum]|nr:hypothetical protein C5167_015992 [Papaver somniferum]